MGDVAVDHPDRAEAGEAGPQLGARERPEPAQVDVADPAAVLPQPPHGGARGHGHRPQPDEHDLGVVGHVLVEERRAVALAEELVELPVGLLDHPASSSGGLPVLAPQLHDPVLIDLGCDGDRVIGMEAAISQVEGRQEAPDRLSGRHSDHVLGVRQERTVEGQRHRHPHAGVLGHPVADQHVLKGLLGGRRPAQQPAHVAAGEGVVVLDTEGARVVERTVADQEQNGQPIGGRHHQRLEAIHPAGAAATGERSRTDRAGVLDDLELRMLAVGHDVLGVELAVGDDPGEVVHHLRVRADRVGRDDVHVGQADGLRHRLAAGEQLLPLVRDGLLGESHRVATSFRVRRARTAGAGRTSTPVPVMWA